jgi:hypothetical protein
MNKQKPIMLLIGGALFAVIALATILDFVIPGAPPALLARDEARGVLIKGKTECEAGSKS